MVDKQLNLASPVRKIKNAYIYLDVCGSDTKAFIAIGSIEAKTRIDMPYAYHSGEIIRREYKPLSLRPHPSVSLPVKHMVNTGTDILYRVIAPETVWQGHLPIITGNPFYDHVPQAIDAEKSKAIVARHIVGFVRESNHTLAKVGLGEMCVAIRNGKAMKVKKLNIGYEVACGDADIVADKKSAMTFVSDIDHTIWPADTLCVPIGGKMYTKRAVEYLIRETSNCVRSEACPRV